LDDRGGLETVMLSTQVSVQHGSLLRSN